ncbi:MAG: hypothetical protein ACRCZZ_07800 [Phocaeicola sp.]
METNHGTSYREVLESNYGKLTSEQTMGDAKVAHTRLVETLESLCGEEPLVLKCNELNYMTLFNAPEKEYIAAFLRDEANFEKSEFPGIKHFEKSGIGVSILIGENTYFLFSSKLIAVDCTDGFYPEVSRVGYEKECTR